MKVIIVEDMYECPFKGSYEYQLSELTSAADDVCLLRSSDECIMDKCPLIKEKQITVKWRPR